MSSVAPAYHLRPNKAVERMLFIELLRKLDRNLPKLISTYTYVGLGGPYLEDFNLIQSTFSNKRMVSLESEKHVISRQKLNQPHCRVELKLSSTGKFARKYETTRTPLIVWFDYSEPNWKSQLADACHLVRKLPPMSIFKATLIATMKKVGGVDVKKPLESRKEILNRIFGDYGPFVEEDVRNDVFPKTLYKIFRKALQHAVPDSEKRCVRSLASYIYDDGTPILTITTIVGPIEQIESLAKQPDLLNWPFADINWGGPKKIVVPHLSLREKLAIDRLLPDASARTIMNVLKLRFAEDYPTALQTISNYVQFYNHIPQFLRVNL